MTARARERRQVFHSPERRDWFQDLLFGVLREEGWTLEAWAVLSNHYHIVAHSPPEGGISLGPVVRRLHSLATKRLNAEDGTPGRTRLWQNYRETHLTYQGSYFARLNYVHQNPRHHGLVPVASQWPWCSAAAFEMAVSPAWARTVGSFPFDQIAREDGDCGVSFGVGGGKGRRARQQGCRGESGSRAAAVHVGRAGYFFWVSLVCGVGRGVHVCVHGVHGRDMGWG